LGIDFGTDWFTIALANPGRPLDLVLNRDANRQTASVVTVNGLERTFGSNAIAIAPRMPEKTFMAVRNLLGVSFDSDIAAAYRKQFPNKMIKDPETGSVAFQYGSAANETLTVQEIVAMQLRYARQLVKESEGIVVKDAVFTVPSFFDQSQRQAMLDAANLAGFRTLALVNDGSAVALNYAMSRTFTKPERHLFYDMGAGKTVATVAGFYATPATKGSKTKKATIIKVNAYAADSALGGQELDFIVREFLAEKFAASNPSASDIKTSARAMNRLLKEAKRVKTILSANTEAAASVEGLHEGIDFRTRITREDLEKASSHLVPRIRAPIDSALKASNLTIGDIDSIVLVGGGSRVPFVQQALSAAFGADKLSKNVNADEACVMGAVFKGATLSSQFKVRDMRLRDAMSYAVRGTFAKETKSLLGNAKQETLYLYPEFAAVGARRVIHDTRSSDFAIEFESKVSGSSGKWSKLAIAKISGIPDAVKKLKSKNPVSAKPDVKVFVQTNDLGSFEVLRAEAAFNVTNPKYVQYLEDLVAWGKDKTKTKLRAKPTPQPEHIIEIVPLGLSIEHFGAQKLSEEALKTSRNLLKRMDEDDAARTVRHGAVNQLESLVYHLRDMVEEDEIVAVTTESQREALMEAVGLASEWLEDNAESSPLDEIKSRIAQLKELEEPIVYRRRQDEKRPEHVVALRAIISQAENLTGIYRSEYTQEELEPAIKLLEDLEDILDATSSWLDTMVAKQDALAPSDDPALTTTDMDSKALAIERSLAKLVAKKIKKIVPETTAEEKEDNELDDDDDDYDEQAGDAQDKAGEEAKEE
ncbi:actin-like ATPase domain-containing protein, partial [Martensiomyces pterosporus]